MADLATSLGETQASKGAHARTHAVGYGSAPSPALSQQNDCVACVMYDDERFLLYKHSTNPKARGR